MKKALIELKGISKNFAGVKALQDVDLTIYEGETRCLAGENGCGKSTLIKIIAGVYVPNGGTIVVDGKEYSKLTTQQAIDAGIQIIYQDFAIYDSEVLKTALCLRAPELVRGNRDLAQRVMFHTILHKASPLFLILCVS